MPRVFKLVPLALLLIAGAAITSQATTAIIPTDDDLIVGARAIVRANVSSVSCAYDPARGDIFTYVALNVTEVLKGQITSSEVVLREPGGTVGNKLSEVFGVPMFSAGEDVLLYLDTWKDGTLRVYQMFLGKFDIGADTATRRLMVTRGNAGPEVDFFSGGPGASRARPGQITNRSELSAYEQLVRGRMASTRARAELFESKFYNGVSILNRPPEYDGSRASAITPQFHLYFPNSRWFEFDSGQPVTFLVNPDEQPTPQTVDDIAAGMKAWNSVNGCNVQLVVGGTTNNCYSPEGAPTIVFDDCVGKHAPTDTCSGIIAVSGIFAWSDATIVVNNTTFKKITGSFIDFNPFASCVYSSHCNIQEIATHELGHNLGLHHSWDPIFHEPQTPEEVDATMYFSAHFDGRCASLRTDDINGIVFIYPSPNGSLSITTSSLAPGMSGTAYQQGLAATGEIAPYTWSIVPGRGPLPPGLALSPGGMISGIPLLPGNYAFSIQVADSAAHAVQADFMLVVGVGPLSLDGTQLPAGAVGTAYSHQVGAGGGLPPYVWQVSAGALPPGLSLNASTGLISGTPTGTGTFSFTILVKDTGSSTTARGLQIVIGPPLVMPRISSARYKSGGGKLIVAGENFDPAAVLLLDGVQVTIRSNDGSMIISKQPGLAPGSHQARVQNPGGLVSDPVVFMVN
jgi:hypothetical protein